jgi:hypothetical protein
MAARFDTSTDALSRTAGLPSIAAFTIMGWFKITVDLNANVTFFHFGHASLDQGVQLGTDVDGTTFSCYLSVGTFNGSALAVGTWYHAALTRSGTGAGQCLAYLNGVLNITPTNNATPVAGKITVGNNPFGEFNNGCAASVKVYGAALAAAEILQEMRQYAPARTANLNTFLPLLNTASEFTVDYSGSANTMTAGGTLTAEDGPPIPWRQGRRRAVTAAAAPVGGPAPGGVSTGVGVQRPVARGRV